MGAVTVIESIFMETSLNYKRVKYKNCINFSAQTSSIKKKQMKYTKIEN